MTSRYPGASSHPSRLVCNNEGIGPRVSLGKLHTTDLFAHHRPFAHGGRSPPVLGLRHRKPLLPGLGSVVMGLLLLGAICGLFWALGKATIVSRVAAPAPVVNKK